MWNIFDLNIGEECEHLWTNATIRKYNYNTPTHKPNFVMLVSYWTEKFKSVTNVRNFLLYLIILTSQWHLRSSVPEWRNIISHMIITLILCIILQHHLKTNGCIIIRELLDLLFALLHQLWNAGKWYRHRGLILDINN